MKDIEPLLKSTHNYGFYKGLLVGFILAILFFVACVYKIYYI
jgi:uncharacterized integral membrane protein